MYEEFFHFSIHPFRNSPDPRFFFQSVNHRDALAMLAYGIREGKGFMLVMGDVGTGKTMLVQTLKAELADRAILIEVAYPWVSADDILSALRARIGLAPVPSENPEAVDSLRERLLELVNEGREVVLVIDEAHQLPIKTLEGIRLISNIETNTRKLLQIVLLGQEELGTLLSQYSLRQVQQRIALSCHLKPLNRAETADYIRHRLRVANGNPELFSAGAADLVYQYSGGCPRLINQACDYCLLYAFGKFAPAVHDNLAKEALHSMVSARAIPAIPQPEPAAASVAVPPRSAPAAAPAPPPSPRGEEPQASVPFAIPGAGQRSATPGAALAPSSRGLLLLGWVMVLVAMALGATAVWLVLNRGAEGVSPARVTGRAPELSASAPLAPSIAAETATRLGLGLPVGRGSPGARAVETSRDLSLALLASQHYGAWNATIRDLLADANPHLGGLDSVPAGTRVKLPVLARADMVVQDASARSYVFFASFETEEAALKELEPLRRIWTNALVVTSERGGSRVFRLYVGPFQGVAEANNVAAALWHKFIPALGQDSGQR